MRLAPFNHRGPRQAGIALIIVMIAILVLSMLAWKFAAEMKVETTLARNSNNEAELEWIGRSGVEYARWVLGQEGGCAPFDSLNQIWSGGTSDPCATNGALAEVQREVPLGHGSFTWKITDLESLANINMCIAPGGDRLLQQALVLVGVDAGELPPLTGAILDWMDPDDNPHLDGAENDYYHGLNPPYDAKNGPIDDLSELLMVKGIIDHPEIYWGGAVTNHQAGIIQQQYNRNGVPIPQAYPVGLVNLFTPMSAGRINVNTASAEVLQLVPGIDALMAQAIVDGRQGDDDGSGLLGPYPTVEAVRRIPDVSPIAMNGLRQFCTHESKTFRIEIDARIDKYTRQFVAVVRRNDRRNPRDIQILTFYWK